MCICDPMTGRLCAHHQDLLRRVRSNGFDATARAEGYVPLAEVLDALRERKPCDCPCRDANLTCDPGDRMHTGSCASWPDKKYTEAADHLAERFATTASETNDPWRLAEWRALPNQCLIHGCDGTVDERGPIWLRDGSMRKACTEHWEPIMRVLGEQAAWQKTDAYRDASTAPQGADEGNDRG